ncbi:MAG TPA: hypothetical protein VMT82_01630, partial [candidate division Zixibacteria bacterium]|nr:hypothetical protein [candidate division Zixibacteria bacterium]
MSVAKTANNATMSSFIIFQNGCAKNRTSLQTPIEMGIIHPYSHRLNRNDTIASATCGGSTGRSFITTTPNNFVAVLANSQTSPTTIHPHPFTHSPPQREYQGKMASFAPLLSRRDFGRCVPVRDTALQADIEASTRGRVGIRLLIFYVWEPKVGVVKPAKLVSMISFEHAEFYGHLLHDKLQSLNRIYARGVVNPVVADTQNLKRT